MANFFDQFDSSEPMARGNFFDQFDAPQENKTVGFTGEPSPALGARRTSGVLGMFSIPNIIEGLYNAIKAAPRVTKDVMEGRLDPTSEEGIRRVAPLASLAVMPAAGRGAVQVPAKPIMNEAVQEAASRGYQAAADAGLELGPSAVHRSLSAKKTELEQFADPELMPVTMRMLDKEIKKYSGTAEGEVPKEIPNVSLRDLDAFRQRIGIAIKDSGISNTDRSGLVQLRNAIDEIPTSAEPHEVVAGNVPEAIGAIQHARGNYAAAARQEALDNLKERALDQAGKAASGQNIENALRAQFASFIRPDARGKSAASRAGFNEAEIAEMRQFVREGAKPSSNAARAASNIMGGGLGIGAPIVGSLFGHLLPHHLGLATPLIGSYVKGAGNRAAMDAVDAMAQRTLTRSPYGAAQPPTGGLLALPPPGLLSPSLAVPELSYQR